MPLGLSLKFQFTQMDKYLSIWVSRKFKVFLYLALMDAAEIVKIYNKYRRV